jgi:hypothetical protein
MKEPGKRDSAHRREIARKLCGVFALGESLTLVLVAAGGLMAIGVWLHVTEHHEHEHIHESVAHAHSLT